MTKNVLRNIMGENIRIERISRGFSIDELSEILGLTAGFVGLIERGQRGATPLTLYKLSKIFGLSIDSFYYPRQSASNLNEEPEITVEIKRKKIESLISDFSEKELDFVILMIKNLRVMNRQPGEEEDGEDYY